MPMMRLKISFGGSYTVLVILLLLCCVTVIVSGCFSTGLEFLTEELLPAVCPLLAATTSTIKDLFQAHSVDDEPISSDLVTECMRCGCELTRQSSNRGKQLVQNGITLESCTPAMLHFYSGELPADMRQASEASQEILAATKVMQMKVCSSSNVTPNTFMSFLEHQVIRLRDGSTCKPLRISCSSSNYRSIDGSCNNLRRPGWGRRGAPFTRIATPRYADGIYAMPVSRSGRGLPNPRSLSTRLFSDQTILSRGHNYMNMQWGQYVTHDMMMRVMEVTSEGGIQCCLGDGVDMLPSEWQNDKCIPIAVPEDDPFYRYHGIKCLNFVRSVTTPRDDCSLGYAEQMNTVTSFIDGSPIYGSDKKLASRLRTKVGGKLRQETRENCVRGFLPTVKDKAAVCDLRNSSEPCYLAGDGRINQTPTLALLHTLLLREHNRVADILGSMNPLWSDEKIYQEARRIVVAEIQHITYQEWLPLNFGENYFRYYRIVPSTLYSHDYSEEVNPGVINGFAAAAFRSLHSVIPDSIMTLPWTYHTAYVYKLSDHYFNPGLLEYSTESFDDIVRGIIAQPSSDNDPFFTAEITNLLFKSHNSWGLDLIAMDIQRGRDHGIASYNEYREICGLTKARTFQDFAGEMTQDRINALITMYESVDDVDLFVGGVMERSVHGSVLGHTFQCLVAEQFYRTRVGDRFFYDNAEMPHSFTSEQLQQIKKASMARLICDNTDRVYYVQRRAFEPETQYNPKYSCEDFISIPYVDLTSWKQPSLFD
ncbi:peroxidase [Amyelois transitella]|uniref:peroxidase n=1 Tax=Amyelois transitella TaxID=680683 RepID=UPI00067E2A75|nr:peroxidase [Amyelois transitella]